MDERLLIEAVEPRLTIRRKPYVPTVHLRLVMDTSGSMFAKVSEAVGGEDVAYRIAWNVVVSVLYRVLRRGVRVEGELAFFSDKHEGFSCGEQYAGRCLTLSEYLQLPTKVGVDYLLLRGTTVATVNQLIREPVKIASVTGGTNPEPIMDLLCEKYGKPFFTAVVTDGEILGKVVTCGSPTYVYVVPGGNLNVPCDRPEKCKVVQIGIRASSPH